MGITRREQELSQAQEGLPQVSARTMSLLCFLSTARTLQLG